MGATLEQTPDMIGRTMVGMGVAAVFALALPGAASAAISAETSGGTLVINGDSSPNTIVVDWDEYFNEVVISDPAPPFEPLTAGAGCVQTVNVGHQNTPELHCSPAGLHAVSVAVGEGDDQVDVAVSRSDELLVGELFPFRVLVVGGEGDDHLQTAGTHGRAFGEQGDDLLYGRIGPTFLSGGPGNDRLTDAEGGNDRLDGGSQGDELDSFAGRDVLIGGDGRDVMHAGKGRDRILAADARRDKRIRCGPGGRDVASVDAVDPVAELCEKVLRIP
jgi:Ca2+-binding RTX toxin-like protein